ncbi:ArsR/SmtB family transcription factor [Desulfonatronum lacustre]|uniref:ArsR/SmtB family transcription factor n=1 Tax=Desulfonatronum lacustre TaxID=66849 RepID=UPI00048DD27E|nr:metalloregulator ArsR/SmtB family transcription factor [Desulfonatronum lacustre]SMP44821.1 transcriptional regulator, ArsR family [Desulfonatronum zhilinae]
MENTLAMAKAMADGNRMRVIAALMEHDELCVCQLIEMLGLAGATVSRHMSILQAARLVQSRKQGRWVFYRLSDEFPELLRAWLRESLAASPGVLADRDNLKAILACDPDDLCRRQREGAECSA